MGCCNFFLRLGFVTGPGGEREEPARWKERGVQSFAQKPRSHIPIFPRKIENFSSYFDRYKLQAGPKV